jgi:NAD(P)H dehydrogenase (quinone)
MAKQDTLTVLVTGASGHLGAKAVETLLERGGVQVIAATRNPGKLSHLSAKGAELRRADFDDPATLPSAFRDVDRLLLVSTDDLETPGKRLRQHRAAVAAAEKAGVNHVVYTSAPAPAPGKALIGDHFWTEQALAASGLGWTILRNHLYADLLLGSLPHAVASGAYVTATGGGARSYVTRDDAARSAAGALLSDFADRRILDVTGPAALTGDQIAAIAAEMTGKPVTHAPVPAGELRIGLARAGLPAGLAEALVQFDVDAAQGFHAVVTPTVAELSGRAPQDLAGFLRAHASVFAATADA